jgi:hypothetical protein
MGSVKLEKKGQQSSSLSFNPLYRVKFAAYIRSVVWLFLSQGILYQFCLSSTPILRYRYRCRFLFFSSIVRLPVPVLQLSIQMDSSYPRTLLVCQSTVLLHALHRYHWCVATIG